MVKKVVPLSKQTKTGNIRGLLRLHRIEDHCYVLRSQKGEEAYRAVVAVAPVNFSLMSETEQEAVLAGYRALLQRLQIGEEISIHVRTMPYDLAAYQFRLRDAQQSDNRVIADLALDHEQFLFSLVAGQKIVQREFYVRLSARVDNARRKDDRAERAKSYLDLLAAKIIEDLGRSGLTGSRLNNEELAQYYLSCSHMRYAANNPINPAILQGLDLPPVPIRLRSLGELEDLAQGDYPEWAYEVPDSQKEQENAEPGPLDLVPLADTQTPTKDRGRWFWLGDKKQQPTTAKGPAAFTDLLDVLQPATVEQTAQYIRILRDDYEYFRARAITAYPAQLIAGWFDSLIQLNEPYVEYVLHANTLDPQGFTQKLRSKLTRYQASQSIDSKKGKIENPYISAASREVQALMDALVAQEERVHSVSIMIGTRAHSPEELRDRDALVAAQLRGLDLESVPLTLEHLQAWQSFLPENEDYLKRTKILDTSCVVTGFPFASANLSTEPGALLGVTSNGTLVILNPFSNLLDNAHEIKFARSGAGKSYHEKVWLARMIIEGIEVIIVDPEGEYLALTQRLGGVTIRLASGQLQINPFDLPYVADGTDRDILAEKFQSLLTLFDLMLAERAAGGVLSQREKSFLSRVLTVTYGKAGITGDTATHKATPPCMDDFYHVLRSGEAGADTFSLGDRLERYLPAFPQETVVSLDNALVVFNIRELDDELKPVGLFLVTEFVWTQIRREKHPRQRLLSIDEAWTLMQFQEGGRFLAGMSRRARKYNLGLRIITQDVEDFLSSEHGRTVLKMAASKFLMKQDPTTIQIIADAFHLSDRERQFLLGCGRGEGLYFSGLSHVPVQVVASPQEHEIATTNPQERLELEAAQEQQTAQEERRNLRELAREQEEKRNLMKAVMPQGFYAPNAEEEEENQRTGKLTR